MTNALYSRRMDYIKFNMSRQSQDQRPCGLARVTGFPMVQGAIDRTHVALRVTPHNEVVFRNHKRFHSLNVQLVGDHRQTTLAVNAHYPGSCHDAFILQESSAPQLLQPPHEGRGWLSGDKGFGLATWPMTPLCNPTTPAEQRYNHSHATTRTRTEQTIGVLKQRFRCLERSEGAFQYSPERVSMFTVVCCMLHNLDITGGQPLPPGMPAAPQEDSEEEDEKLQPWRRQPDTVAAARDAHQRLIAQRFQ
uniref:putative nuclease HARBI1 n=1 Tax=Pristiophorus japonicus TaxID=55135 RepID=UPI00398E6125